MDNKKDKTTTTPKVPFYKDIFKNMSRKSYKVFNAIIIVVAIVIFSVVNIIANVIVDKNPSLVKDWTQGTYGLNKITKEYFEYLENDITIKVLMEEEKVTEIETDYGFGYQVNRLLHEMSAFDNVTLEYENVITTPVKVLSEKYPDVDWGATDNMLLVSDDATGKYKVVSVYQVFAYNQDQTTGEYYIYNQAVEAAVLTAVQHITSEKVVKVGLSTGNGEFFNEQSENVAFCSDLTFILDDNAYVTEEINLMTDVPSEDMEVIIMMAPSADLTAEAVDALSLWLRNDGDYGRTLLYVPFDQPNGETPNLDLLLEQWGMKLTDGYIKENAADKAASLGDTRSDRFALMDYYDDTYTKGIRTDLQMIMPDCVPVEIIDENVASPLLVTSDKATVVVASSDSDLNGTELPATGNALNGAAIGIKTNEDKDKKSAVVVWGSLYSLRNEFTSGEYAHNVNNATYLINLLNNFTSKTEDNVLVESAGFENTSILVNSAQQTIVGILFIFVVPVGLVVMGIVVWVRRRHR